MQFLQAEDFIAKHYLRTGQKNKETRFGGFPNPTVRSRGRQVAFTKIFLTLLRE